MTRRVRVRKQLEEKIYFRNEIPRLKFALKLLGLTPYGESATHSCKFSSFLLSWLLLLNLCALMSLSTNILYGKLIYKKSTSIAAFASSVMIVFSACAIFIPHLLHYKNSKKLIQLLLQVEKIQKRTLDSTRSSFFAFFDFYNLQFVVYIIFDLCLLVELCYTDPAVFWHTSSIGNFLKQFSCLYSMASVVTSFACYRATIDVIINLSKKFVVDLKARKLTNPFHAKKKLEDILKLSNDTAEVFGFWIVSMFLIYLMIAIVLIFDYLRLRDLHGINHVVAIIVAIWNIFMYCDVAQQFTNKAEDMEITLRQVAFRSCIPNIQTKFMALADQVEIKKNLKACNYVVIGRGTFTSIMEVMTTYVVIMYQLGDVSECI